ncbi:hypothetical protein [Sphingomonas hankyongi]|uniref:DUF1616 domain-containing protein n=1 Tax=Sphingomonas hankyongi TaxID=2908209 RepID=A0ABT0S559_9SPHN|nr:hypothetical protein [Sphingomonas hankyongi]MCL6730768.1 hypothetical protein [Sphingomonas hankyongi]
MAFSLILACLALILLVGIARRKTGRAVTDLAVLVVVFGIITVLDLVLSRFMDTGHAAELAALIIAAAFALDSLYGLMAPERQRRRDRRLREMMQRRRA